MSEAQDDVWESSDAVRLTIVLTREDAERLAADAERREISSSDLAAELVRRGLSEPNERSPGS